MDFVPLRFDLLELKKEFQELKVYLLSVEFTHSFLLNLAVSLVILKHLLEKLEQYEHFFRCLLEKLVTQSRLNLHEL